MADAVSHSSLDKDAVAAVQLSSDRMTATIVGVSPQTGEGAPLDIPLLQEQLVAAGVTAAPDIDALRRIIGSVRNGRDLRGGVVVARGIPPVPGQDGRVELLVETDLSTGAVDEDGRIDYRDRGLVKTATAGQILGKLVPPTSGIPGSDVCGREVKPRPGRPVAFTPGDNVFVADNGKDIIAGIGGMIRYAGNTLSVTAALEISGDVDFSTGDVKMSEGVLKVRGTVRSGFTVQAAEGIEVAGSVEDAEVTAGGDVKVAGGLLKGTIHSSGAVSVKYAEHAKIVARGNVTVESGAFNCDITAYGSVAMGKGKGLIRGGTVRAALGMEVVEIGSAAAAGTHIIIGLAAETQSALIREKAELEAELFLFTHKHGELDLEGIANRFGDASNPKVERALQRMARLRIVERLLARENERMQRHSRSTLAVSNAAHAGTLITIAGKTVVLPHDVYSSRFFFDKESGEIRWCAL